MYQTPKKIMSKSNRPLYIHNAEKAKIKNIKFIKDSASVSKYQNPNCKTYSFYRPISKIFSLDHEE